MSKASKLNLRHRRFLFPDGSGRVDAIGWKLDPSGLTIRLNDHESGLFWSWNAHELVEARVVLANLIEPLQILQAQLEAQ